MKRIITGIWVGMLLVLAAGAVFATQVIQRTPRELAGESALIVEGRVTGVRAYWNAERTRIYTEATVSVASTYKGGEARSVRVVQPGGVVGNVRMTAQGALSWERGEEVLLFLEPALPGTFQVAGFSQGKYEIERDARTGRGYVRQAHAGDRATRRPSAEERLTVEQFINQVLPQE